MRAFIVGNGPSLAVTPLEKLIGEISFATNRIRLIYNDTAWRPTHYVRAEEASGLETDAWKDDVITHLEMPGVKVFCNTWFTKKLSEIGYTPKTKPEIIEGCAHYTKHFHDEDCPHLWHLPRICTFGSSVNVAIQIAVKLGYGPLYLVGCDLGYKDGQPSHFLAEYESGYESSLRPAKYANLDTLTAHMVALRSSPVKIYNATIGGALEVYPRVSYAELFDE